VISPLLFGFCNKIVLQTPWSNSPSYVSFYRDAVASWTGDPTCNDGAVTSSQSNANWKAQSILTGTGGNFDFSTVGMGAWACYSDVCGPNQVCPNNSAAQGEQLYNLFTSSNHPLTYTLTGIVNCQGPEGVPSGKSPDTGATGQSAVESDMEGSCHAPVH